MDLQTLSNLFATTYNPDPNIRKAAELQIRKVRVDISRWAFSTGDAITIEGTRSLMFDSSISYY